MENDEAIIGIHGLEIGSRGTIMGFPWTAVGFHGAAVIRYGTVMGQSAYPIRSGWATFGLYATAT